MASVAWRPAQESSISLPMPAASIIRPMMERPETSWPLKETRTAGQFDAVVRVSFKGQEVSGLSIMGLMMLAAGIGSEIELTCAGRQATDAMAALSALVEGKFGEE